MSRAAQGTMLDFAIVTLEHGWLDARLSNGREEVVVTASYLSDAPRDLLAAVADLVQGAAEASATWLEEPGEYQFEMRVIGGEMHLRVFWLAGRFNESDTPSRELAFSGKDKLHRWGKRVSGEFNRLLREYGEVGYKERWVLYDFPSREYRRLQAALARE